MRQEFFHDSFFFFLSKSCKKDIDGNRLNDYISQTQGNPEGCIYVRETIYLYEY